MARAKAELSDIKVELTDTKAELTDTKAELTNAKEKLTAAENRAWNVEVENARLKALLAANGIEISEK